MLILGISKAYLGLHLNHKGGTIVRSGIYSKIPYDIIVFFMLLGQRVRIMSCTSFVCKRKCKSFRLRKSTV